MSLRTRGSERVRLGSALLVLVLGISAATSCSRAPRARTYLLALPEGLTPAQGEFRFVPSAPVKQARLDRLGQLFVTTDGRKVVVQAPGLCPVTLSENAAERIVARPLLDFGPLQRAQVGYDAELEIRVTPGCVQGKDTPIAWKQVEGAPLARLTVSEQGRRVSLRTLPLSAFFSEPLPRGIVAVSPRSQGRYVLEATASLAGTALTTRLSVTSMARATGLSSLAVSQRVMLGTPGLTLRTAPRGSGARVESWGQVDTFAANLPGRYVLSDGTAQLTLQALAHERTPLDCGRSECHPSEAAAARDTAMSQAMARLLDAHGATPPQALACALECHVVGEAGVHDGGFVDVARSLGAALLPQARFADWPTDLRRLGAVRCTACHGPGAIPSVEGRARILRVDVCASCHDAPPRYTHVQQWSRSSMARADADERTRGSERCARCHTTGGFLDAIGVRKRADRSRDADDVSVGISCAACHAAHGDHLERALVRRTQPASALAASERWQGTPSALCSQCHAPTPSAPIPEASSAAIWLGRIAYPESLGGGILEGPAPHAAIPGGCLGCHGASAKAGGGTSEHSFAVDQATCAGCHVRATGAEADAALGAQARQLLAELSAACGTPVFARAPDGALRPTDTLTWPRHADEAEQRCRASQSVQRARYAVLLVLEDGAAARHNRPFCEQIFEQARLALRRR